MFMSRRERASGRNQTSHTNPGAGGLHSNQLLHRKVSRMRDTACASTMQLMWTSTAAERLLFALLGQVHERDDDMRSHKFQTKKIKETEKACVHCGEQAVVYCKDCRALYCLADFRRIHAKGSQ